jgi:hypothetical protein
VRQGRRRHRRERAEQHAVDELQQRRGAVVEARALGAGEQAQQHAVQAVGDGGQRAEGDQVAAEHEHLAHRRIELRPSWPPGARPPGEGCHHCVRDEHADRERDERDPEPGQREGRDGAGRGGDEADRGVAPELQRPLQQREVLQPQRAEQRAERDEPAHRFDARIAIEPPEPRRPEHADHGDGRGAAEIDPEQGADLRRRDRRPLHGRGREPQLVQQPRHAGEAHDHREHAEVARRQQARQDQHRGEPDGAMPQRRQQDRHAAAHRPRLELSERRARAEEMIRRSRAGHEGAQCLMARRAA